MMMRRTLLPSLIACALALLAASPALAASPTITVDSPSGVSTSTFTVHATITPGGTATYYKVDWGLTSSYTNSSQFHELTSTKSTRTVSLTLSGLLPGSVYHYRFDALNKYGGSVSADHSVRTQGNPPADVATGGAVVTGDYVTVTGIINPHGQTTYYYFQYAPMGVLAFTNTAQQILPGTSTPQVVSFPLFGLAPATTFAFRLVAIHTGSSGNATTPGAFGTFLTFPSVRRTPGVSAGTRPRRALRRPFILTTAGQLRPPSGIPAADACPQSARLTIVYGRHRLVDELVEVGADCTFHATETIGSLPRSRHHPAIVRVYIHFPGNGYVAPTATRAVRIQLGR